jgi:hypothetical protein
MRKMKFSAESVSILKSWGRRAMSVIVRLRALAPYAMMELVLPGGSVMAFALWLYRRRKNGGGAGQWQPTALIDAIKQRWGHASSMIRAALVGTQWDLCPAKKLLAMRQIGQSHYRSST